MNARVINPLKANYSDAYKVGMGKEKQLNTFADLAARWEQEGKKEWHHQTADFWGPIFKNLKEGGGWLHIDEIFDTGEEDRFSPKRVTEEEARKRKMGGEEETEDDPAGLLFQEVAKVYQRGENVSGFPLNQSFDTTKIEMRIQRKDLGEEKNRGDQQRLERDVDGMIDLEEPLVEFSAVQEVTNWDVEFQNAWYGFRDVPKKSRLTQPVTVEAHVRNRRAQWIGMKQEKQELYTTWKAATFAQRKADDIRVRDAIMSMECLHLPQQVPNHGQVQ
jgi:hypothetical protein